MVLPIFSLFFFCLSHLILLSLWCQVKKRKIEFKSFSFSDYVKKDWEADWINLDLLLERVFLFCFVIISSKMNTLFQLVATIEKSGMKAAGRYQQVFEKVHLFWDNIENSQGAECCRCVITLTSSLRVSFFFSFHFFLPISTAQFMTIENGGKNEAGKVW